MAAELLTVGEAAKRLGCSKKWIYKLLDQERLKFKRFGSVYQIYASSVKAFGTEGTRTLRRARTAASTRNGNGRAVKA